MTIAKRNFDSVLPTLGLALSDDPNASAQTALQSRAFDETIVPQSMLVPLEKLTVRDAEAEVGGILDGPELRTIDAIGEGGMGIVYRADQLRLRREVAIKRIRPERRGPATTTELLREAWLMGSLEHPNIVPVHTLAADAEDGSPLMVMKRIEGTEWNEILNNEQRPLMWHLNVLLQVCDALHFAHSRGIVHRDIKPQNVMIGAFGEVYLLDWGIAVSLREEDRGRVLLARESTGLAGTPGYMAPEMVAEDAAAVATTTDVYLLGATLHQLVTGKAPHEGNNLIEMLQSAFESKPRDYGPDVPEEIADICNRAMHIDPGQRFQDAGAFKEALGTFLEHRESMQLVRSAESRLGQLEAYLGLDRGDDDKGLLITLTQDEELLLDSHSLDRVFNEARYGFRQALAMWPENAAARRGLRRTLETMTRIAIAQEDLKTVTRMVNELNERAAESVSASLPSDLLAGYQALHEQVRHKEARVAELEEMGREFDTTAADRIRGRVAIAVAVICVGPGILAGIAAELGMVTFGIDTLLWLVGAVLVESVIGLWFLRKHIIVNTMSRRFAWAWLGAMTLSFVFIAGAAYRGSPAEDVLVDTAMLCAYGFGATAILADRRLYPLPILYTIVYVVLSFFPAHGVLLIASANFLGALILARIWSQAPQDPPMSSASS